MINYIWWQTILQNLVKLCSAVSEELRPQSVPIANNVKNEQSHDSQKNCQIKIVVKYGELHIVTNNLTKFGQILFSRFWGVASTSFRPTDGWTDTSISMSPLCIAAGNQKKKQVRIPGIYDACLVCAAHFMQQCNRHQWSNWIFTGCMPPL